MVCAASISSDRFYFIPYNICFSIHNVFLQSFCTWLWREPVSTVYGKEKGKTSRLSGGGKKLYVKAMQSYIRIKGPVRSEWMYLQEVHQ